MKKKNINYGSLAERGIRKAWDKVVCYTSKNDSINCQMVVYYNNKPFIHWVVDDPFNIERVKLSLSSALGFYSRNKLNNRKTSKYLANNFIQYAKAEKVVTYRNGGVLFPKEA